ncbi:rhamnan synthesis F family protein [Erythrobacter sp. W53]|uniref:rhamnan synthesis F family protein n=1 Tax=Erythrobacter sp. W53 TaxID=3425947 RepID=UPI003D767A7F
MKRACIFVSYWAEPELPGYIHHHVEALAALDFDIFFVSNSPLDEASEAQLGEYCKSVRQRENVGFDFGAWRDELRLVELSGYDGLLLTNSSIVGPLFDLSPMFADMDKRGCDFWGLTLNRLFKDHLQSFFLYFQPQVWQSQSWDTFWGNVKDHADKRQIILDYELELYSHFQSAGFTGSSYIKPNPLWTMLRPSMLPGRRKKPVYYDDPTIARPFAIVRQGFPYVKASLLWGEAKDIGPSLDQFKRRIKTDYDWSLAESMLS